MLQIRPWGVLVYERREFDGKSEKVHNSNKTVIKSYTGKITTYSKKRLKRAIGLMVATAKDKECENFKTGKTFKFKVNFITLTLPSAQKEITDKSIKVCLDNWIKRAKRKYKLNSYVWRAERQKNGNLHFHIITDTYIRYDNIRNDWNDTLAPLGFIKEYQAKHGMKQANSTDVHAVWKVKNLVQYFVKYMSKDHKEGEKPIQGKVWDCSKNLKTKENCEMALSGSVTDNFDKLCNDQSLVKVFDANFTLVFVPPDMFIVLFPPEWLEAWNDYLNRIRVANF